MGFLSRVYLAAHAANQSHLFSRYNFYTTVMTKVIPRMGSLGVAVYTPETHSTAKHRALFTAMFWFKPFSVPYYSRSKECWENFSEIAYQILEGLNVCRTFQLRSLVFWLQVIGIWMRICSVDLYLSQLVLEISLEGMNISWKPDGWWNKSQDSSHNSLGNILSNELQFVMPYLCLLS